MALKVITGKKARMRRCLIYGTPGVGKSTWAASWPNVYAICSERGMDDIGCDRCHVATFDEFREALMAVSSEDHDYRTLVIDSADWLEQLLWKAICQKYSKESLADFDFGQGYAKANKAWEWICGTITELCDRRNMGSVIVAHAKIDRYTPPTGAAYDRWQLDLHKGAASHLCEWADEVFFVKYREYEVAKEKHFSKESRIIAIGEGERVCYTAERPAFIAKRHIEMPDEMPFPKTNGFAEYQRYWPTGTSPAGNINGIVKDGHSKQKETKE